MDFRLDEEQRELQDTVRRFCADRLPLERVAREGERPLDRTLWREMAELGLFSVLADGTDRAAGAGMVGAAIVFEQLGAHLVDGPVLWTCLAAPFVGKAAAGEYVVGGVDVASGTAPWLVEHAGEIDALLILRRDGVFVGSGADLPAFEPLAALDPLTPAGRCDALPTGTRVGDAGDAARLRLAGAVLCSALQVGVSSAALEASRRYALDREQFDVPIGSFQAIQHMLADMYVRDALARSASYAAAAAADDPESGDALRASDAAKVVAGEAALENARAAIQIHGGIGFTWDALPSHLLKRAWVLEYGFGDADAHARAVGAALVGRVA